MTDFPSAQTLCMNCGLQGVVKIQHQTGKIVRHTEKLVVTFLAEKLAGQPNLGAPSMALKWVSLSELRGLSSFVVDTAVRLLVQSVHSGAAIYPVSLVECLDVQGARKRCVCFSVFTLSPLSLTSLALSLSLLSSPCPFPLFPILLQR